MALVRARALRHLEALVGAFAAAGAGCDARAGDAAAPPPPPPPEPVNLGYSVVDEMPAPAACEDFAGALVGYANPRAGGVLVRVTPRGYYDDGVVLLGDDPAFAVDRAVVVNKAAIPGEAGWAFELAVPEGAQATGFTLPGTCEGVRSAARVELRWEGALTGGSQVAVVILGVALPTPTAGPAHEPTPDPTPKPAPRGRARKP